MDKMKLENSSNKIEDITIREETYHLIIKSETQETVKKEMVVKNIIEKRTFENEILNESQLKNTLFYECSFINCQFDQGLSLDASTDFFKCLFENMQFQYSIIQKVNFDQSHFQNIEMQGHFHHCSFIGCLFSNITFSGDISFKSCNFAMSNAKDIFDIEKQHMEYVELEISQYDEEIINAVNNLYEVMKSKDKILQKQISITDKDNMSSDIMINYMLNLDDRSYIDFITNVGAKRKVGH